jgi:hypothetical protein
VLYGQIKGLKFSHSQFFGFVSIAGPKAGQKHELYVKFSGIRTGTHNLEVAGSSPAPATNRRPKGRFLFKNRADLGMELMTHGSVVRVHPPQQLKAHYRPPGHKNLSSLAAYDSGGDLAKVGFAG